MLPRRHIFLTIFGCSDDVCHFSPASNGCPRDWKQRCTKNAEFSTGCSFLDCNLIARGVGGAVVDRLTVVTIVSFQMALLVHMQCNIETSSYALVEKIARKKGWLRSIIPVPLVNGPTAAAFSSSDRIASSTACGDGPLQEAEFH